MYGTRTFLDQEEVPTFLHRRGPGDPPTVIIRSEQLLVKPVVSGTTIKIHFAPFGLNDRSLTQIERRLARPGEARRIKAPVTERPLGQRKDRTGDSGDSIDPEDGSKETPDPFPSPNRFQCLVQPRFSPGRDRRHTTTHRRMVVEGRSADTWGVEGPRELTTTTR